MSGPELRTPRLVLRPLGAGELTEGTAIFETAEDALLETTEAEEHWAAHGFGTWAVRDARSEAFVGVAEIHFAGEGIGGIAPDEIEAGWVIRPDRQGEGLATEAMEAALADAWTRARATAIVAYIRHPNTMSKRVAAKLGFVPRGSGHARSGDPVTIYELRLRLLRSERLRLAPLAERDLAEYAALRGDPRTRVFSRSGVPVPLERARAELEESDASWRANGFGNWRVCELDGTFVGVIHAVPNSDDPSTVELGWTLTPDAWGQGLATEAAGLVVTDLVARASISRINSYLDAENTASRRIAEKLGMRLRESSPGDDGRIVEAWELPRPTA